MTAKKLLTLASLQAVFGVEDAAPVFITYSSKGVSAERDGVKVEYPQVDAALIPSKGTWAVTLKEDNSFLVTKQEAPAAKSKQSPAFDSL